MMVWMNLFSGKQWRNRHREQIYGHGVGEEEEGETYGENNMETYNTIFFRFCIYVLEYGIYLSLSDSLHSV